MRKSAFGLFLVSLGVSSVTAANVQLQCHSINQTQNIACAYDTGSKNKPTFYGLVGVPYALCSKALCQYNPKDPNTAQCLCTLPSMTGWTSASLSSADAKSSQPTYTADHQLASIQSNYSMANLSTFTADKQCQFKQGMPWADCFGVRCKVIDQTMNGIKTQMAACTCPVKRSIAFSITPSGDPTQCNTSPTQVWSATQPDTGPYGGNPILLLYQRFYPQSPPVTSQ